MSKLINEKKTYEYNSKEEAEKEIALLKNSEWQVNNISGNNDKWYVEYIKMY